MCNPCCPITSFVLFVKFVAKNETMKIKVGVVFGGRSVEHEVSIISAIQTIHAIDDSKYEVVPIYISKEGSWYIGEGLTDIESYKNLAQFVASCKKVMPSVSSDQMLFYYPHTLFQKRIVDKLDVIFPVMHGTHGEDGALQGVLELMNIPYVGSDVLASAVGMDKVIQKMILQAANLPIVRYLAFSSQEWIHDREDMFEKIEHQFCYPVIVKPVALGSSIGVANVADRKTLEEAIDTVRTISQRILVEEAVSNLREINCSVLGDHDHVEASVCEEPVGGLEVLSFDDKYISGSAAKGMSGAKRKLPADISPKMSETIQYLAKQAFLTLQCQGVARVDFLTDRQSGKIFVNEVNTIPGSLAFYLWEASGKSFTVLTDELIELALKRHREKNTLIFSYESNILAGYSGTKGTKGGKI